MRRPTKAGIARASKAVIRFFGPVAGAVHGELSKPEVMRSIAKAALNGSATWGAGRVTITDPGVVTEVVLPLTAAIGTGVLDAISRMQQGEPKPPAEPPKVSQ